VCLRRLDAVGAQQVAAGSGERGAAHEVWAAAGPSAPCRARARTSRARPTQGRADWRLQLSVDAERMNGLLRIVTMCPMVFAGTAGVRCGSSKSGHSAPSYCAMEANAGVDGRERTSRRGATQAATQRPKSSARSL
jgi:hypothetical protein